ncbi:MAG: hypothetical protein ABSH22_15085 [Tepidisphaeraceae bacterium]|jgi:hypothetical protein
MILAASSLRNIARVLKQAKIRAALRKQLNNGFDMTVPFQILYVCLFCMFTAMTWMGSRRYGWLGMVGVHILILFLYMLIVPLALAAAGGYEYDGVLSVVGLVLQVFLVNCLLLPVALAAIWKRRRAIMRRQAEGPP